MARKQNKQETEIETETETESTIQDVSDVEVLAPVEDEGGVQYNELQVTEIEAKIEEQIEAQETLIELIEEKDETEATGDLEFTAGEKVLVFDKIQGTWEKRFYHYTKGGVVFCSENGKDTTMRPYLIISKYTDTDKKRETQNIKADFKQFFR